MDIPRETDFELFNGSERWILCKITLNQIQGEKDNIQLDLPQDEILIEPDAHKLLKVIEKKNSISPFFKLSCFSLIVVIIYSLTFINFIIY